MVCYVLPSLVCLGNKLEGTELEFTYYRCSHVETKPVYQDVLEEIEQMGLFKYGGHIGVRIETLHSSILRST